MKVQPTTNKPQPTFGNKIYQFTKTTSYGKCIHGQSRGFDYDVYVVENKQTGNIEQKLYYVTKENKWVKSFLKFFSNNKLHKEVKSVAKKDI